MPVPSRRAFLGPVHGTCMCVLLLCLAVSSTGRALLVHLWVWSQPGASHSDSLRECLSGRDRPRLACHRWVCGHVLPSPLYLLPPRARHSWRPPLQPENSMSSRPLLSWSPGHPLLRTAGQEPPTLSRGVGTPCLWEEVDGDSPPTCLSDIFGACKVSSEVSEQVSDLVLQAEPPPPAFHLSHPTSHASGTCTLAPPQRLVMS